MYAPNTQAAVVTLRGKDYYQEKALGFFPWHIRNDPEAAAFIKAHAKEFIEPDDFILLNALQYDTVRESPTPEVEDEWLDNENP